MATLRTHLLVPRRDRSVLTIDARLPVLELEIAPGIVRNLEPATRYQLSDGVRDFWSLLERAAIGEPSPA